MDERSKAKELFRSIGATSSQSFDSLDPRQRLAIVLEAGGAYEAKHGKPMPEGSESFIRKRFDLLQRRART